MADYKKKRVHHKSSRRAVQHSADIPMSSTATRRKSGGIKVVKGKKLERQRRFRIVATASAVLVAAVIVLSILLPVGLIENITNLTALGGMGSYPYEIYGTQILNTVSRGNYYYVLTDTNLVASTNGGNIIYTRAHGFSKPVISVSETRALIFDQGGTDVNVYNLSKQVCDVTLDGAVITASVSRSGAFAVAYESDSYAASVAVFDKRGQKLYEWNSAKELVNCVELSPSGKRLAVSTIGVSGGKYTARVMVFTYDSADPVFTKEFSDDTVLALDSLSSRGFSVVTAREYSFVSWKKNEATDIQSELEPAMYRSSKGGALIVYNRSGDRGDNKIVLLSKRGKKVSEISFSGIISDIALAHGHIYCISDTGVYMLDKEGQLMRKAECGYGTTHLAVTGTYSVAAVSSGEVESVELRKSEGN